VSDVVPCRPDRLGVCGGDEQTEHWIIARERARVRDDLERLRDSTVPRENIGRNDEETRGARGIMCSALGGDCTQRARTLELCAVE
jgi:hypothetical protein